MHYLVKKKKYYVSMVMVVNTRLDSLASLSPLMLIKQNQKTIFRV